MIPMSPSAIRGILTSSHSWSATPWDYSSMVYLQFYGDSTGIAIYGYGQTIHAKLHLRFEVIEHDRPKLKLTYLESPALLRFT